MPGDNVASRLSAPLESSRQSRPEIKRGIKLWPVFALLPILVVGPAKATGFDSIAGVDTTVLSLVLLFGTSVLSFLRRPSYPIGPMLPFFAFVVVVLIGISRSDPAPYQSWKASTFLLLTAVAASCIPVLVRSREDLRALLVVWFAGGTLLASLVLLVGGAEDLYGRAGIGEATLGPAYLSAAALVAGGAGLGERLIPAPLALTGMVVAGIALVTIGSRGPIVAAAAGLLAWVLLKGARGRSLLVLALIALVAYAGVRQASESALSRLSLFQDNTREQLWADAAQVFAEHPWLGLGWGDFSSVSPFVEYPHNMFLETASELGLVGLLSLALILVSAAVAVLRTRLVSEARAISAVAVVMLVGQQFSLDLTNRVLWIALIPCMLLTTVVAASAPAQTVGNEPR